MLANVTVALRTTGELGAEAFAEIRRRMVLEYFKWDPHVGDAGTLAPFAVVILRGEWERLAGIAERLAGETVLAEEEILRRPELWRDLGVPRGLRRLLAGGKVTPGGPRCMRFDFHPAAEGWRISEVNSDVPGGYAESSHFPRLMAERVGEFGLETAGDPLGAWMGAVARAADRGRVALLCAPGYMEDRQVVACLAAELLRCGCEPVNAGVGEMDWRGGEAFYRGSKMDAVVRFYQAEWMAGLRKRSGWRWLFAGGKTVAVNPATAVFSESKGFPLVWDRLRMAVDTWREMLPETVAARQGRWEGSADWVLKSKYSNNGDEVFFPERMEARAVRRLRRELFWNGKQWVAQRRFASVPVKTPWGEMHLCVGVYVVEGKAAGIYGRLSRGPIVDFAALDVAVLVEGDVA